MNQRAKRILDDYERAVKNLKVACENAVDELDIDGGIKRFEIAFELSWKLIKEYLADLGIICKNPRTCFKYAYQNDLINDEEIWLEMIEDRNLIVHTYNFEESRKVFDRVKEKYLSAFEDLFQRIKKDLGGRSSD